MFGYRFLHPTIRSVLPPRIEASALPTHHPELLPTAGTEPEPMGPFSADGPSEGLVLAAMRSFVDRLEAPHRLTSQVAFRYNSRGAQGGGAFEGFPWGVDSGAAAGGSGGGARSPAARPSPWSPGSPSRDPLDLSRVRRPSPPSSPSPHVASAPPSPPRSPALATSPLEFESQFECGNLGGALRVKDTE